MSGRIPVAGPSITEREIAFVLEAVRHGWYEQANTFQERFEQAMAKHVGLPFAVSTPSCTSAIHLALLALQVGPGDEVIVPDLTWIGSAAPITYVGATPVFCDVDPVTLCLTPKAVEDCLTPRTRAVISVDLYGAMPDYAALRALLWPKGVALIEDAAEAIGSTRDGVPAGGWGDLSVFSFHGSKTVTTGEGGMLLLRDPAMHRAVLTLREHGRVPGGRLFWNELVGFKYRMNGISAALGLAQLGRLAELVELRRQLWRWYRERLEPAGLTVNPEPPGLFNSVWMVTTLIPDLPKESMIRWLGAEGIDARPVFYPLSALPAFEAWPSARDARRLNRVAAGASAGGVNLPTAAVLTEAQVDRVCTRLIAGLSALRRKAA